MPKSSDDSSSKDHLAKSDEVRKAMREAKEKAKKSGPAAGGAPVMVLAEE
jgi:hypothetical protein